MPPPPSTVPGTGTRLAPEAHGPHTDVIVSGRLDDPDDADAVADAIRDLAPEGDPTRVRLVADHPPDRLLALPEAVADQLGLHQRRDLFELRRSLPVPADHPARSSAPAVAVRAFDPTTDIEPWVRANNRAFAHHPDQGAQTPGLLTATLAEPWVDLAGFLVADDPDRPGELAGSCWTRVHPADGDQPARGEIFVIGVDPDHHGRGLGTALVLAGLDHLADAGLQVGTLYVDAANQPALDLYRRLGFAPHLRRRIATR